mmetsp:Transcript_19345/g.42208  ORF Transcript_19345/g.42208 Transcript_19345/m.42208 type:complete len:699 (-) Transcript_19345:41-2137(-)|eukprot:CAMPEP_0170583550 /NCGR_PEP_ID=MMETSP0224-20130122/8196_1 /TAXON_ID=285029 /ORGANISM="Togula jolla, Strain CCCM 725" /LENGTH=698 /DNA_ID=CAMNT_0010906887 /DNA_START=63 /DNA_END=2159 /DNA_ORIENTATION=+
MMLSMLSMRSNLLYLFFSLEISLLSGSSLRLEKSPARLSLHGHNSFDPSLAVPGALLWHEEGPHAFAVCAPPRVGRELWQRLMMRLADDPRWNVSTYQSIGNQLMSVARAQQTTVRLQTSMSAKAVVVRDPTTRLLSAYLTRCREHGEWWRCLSEAPITFKELVAKLETISDWTQVDVNFRHQVDVCGMGKIAYDTIGRLENLPNDGRLILERAGLWQEFGSGWGYSQSSNFGEEAQPFEHLTKRDMDDKVCHFYSPELLQRVSRLYSTDYQMLEYDANKWVERCPRWRNPAPQPQAAVNSLQQMVSAPCAPTASEISVLSEKVQTAPVKFFLHETGVFNFSKATNCFIKALGANPGVDDFDSRVRPNIAEHLGEMWLLQRLREHPSRTMDMDEAQVHVVGIPVFVSKKSSELGNKGQCGGKVAHQRRMKRILEVLPAMPHFQRSQGRNFFFFTTHWDVQHSFTEELLSFLDAHKVMIGTADSDYIRWYPYPNIQKIILPYKVHSLLEASALDEPITPPSLPSVSFTFHGDMLRRHDGQQRDILATFAELLPNTNIVNSTFSLVADYAKQCSHTASIVKESRFCFVPAGDSPTSRRLFDAVAAGCIPVVMSDFDGIARNLPFSKTVDWSQHLLFGGSLQCTSGDVGGSTQWLGAAHDRYELTGRQMRQNLKKLFREHLSYTKGHGLVTSLLSELRFYL